jgi:hypothetical protein
MIALTGFQVIDLFRSLLGSFTTNNEAKEFSRRVVEDKLHWKKAAIDGAAGTATAEIVIDNTLRHAGTVVAVRVAPSAALTAADATPANIIIRRRPAAAPGTPVVIATCTTNLASGNWTAWQMKDFTSSIASAAVLADDVITVEITKTGAGTVVPPLCLEMVVV